MNVHPHTRQGPESRRGTVLRLLRENPGGCTHQDFRAHGIGLWRAHVESLSLERGLEIRIEPEITPGYGSCVRAVLVQDDWAGELGMAA